MHEICEGETYEVCLTTELHSDGAIDPLAAYRALRARNPAPHAALLRLGDVSVLSSSPERFLRVDRERIVESKPIKGTAPRAAHPAEDAYRAAALRADDKSRAENLMIVDLVRNDLGRVCALGSVEVPALMAIESYATVHQLVTTVRGRLRDDATAIDCIRAAFPGGSMTGAPKLRTMEIIDRLERGPRGVYSGALGFLSVNGTVDLSIVIRTLVASPHGLQIGSGGAIVAASDPDAEHDEMLLKARAVLEAVGGTLDGQLRRARMSALPAADSWLVADGRVRAVERHWARFTATCREHGVELEALAALRARVEQEVPSEGRWFPRVELHANGELAVRVRPAPPREPTVVAWLADVPDPRRAPRHKGPDLGRLAALRERAAARGAGEAVLADAGGRLLEGAFTSLLWWEGDTLWAVPDDAPILPGVTRALLIELARGRGTHVAQRRPAPRGAGQPRDLVRQRPARHPGRDTLGGRRSRGRRCAARGRLAAGARGPRGLSRCHQRRRIADERCRSRCERQPPIRLPAGGPAPEYDPSGSEGERDPSDTPVR